MMRLILFYLFALSRAQRPSNASTCDYYAQNLYGANTSQSQYNLVQHIVVLAFGGPPSNSSSISPELTGILNPGSFQNLNVDLQPWFNGSIDSTNLNNQAVGIDWLDGGGLGPLHAYINGSTSSVMLPNTTNQYRLFTHFYQSFSHVFGCSNFPPAPPSNTGASNQPLSIAYVHKFMNLNYTDLGYFIDQLSKATIEYGFSEQDSLTLNTNLNSNYNAKCIPPVTTNPLQGPQLLSLCQADSCPLAEPNPDCAAYINLTANGIQSAAPSEQTITATPTAFIPTTISSGTSATATAASATPSTIPPSTKAALSPGAIAGIAIGGAAVLILSAIAIILALRRRKTADSRSIQHSSWGMGSPPGEQKVFSSFTSQTMSPPFSPALPPTNQMQMVAEMDGTHGRHGVDELDEGGNTIKRS